MSTQGTTIGLTVKKLVLMFVLTLTLFAALRPLIGDMSALVAIFVAGLAVNVYYADPSSDD